MKRIVKNKITSEKGNYKVLAIIMVSLILAFIVSSFVITIDRIVGRSMEPTLYENNWVIVNKLAYMNTHPQQDDIIVFYKKDITEEMIVKRIIAISGDVVEIKNGQLLVNNQLRKDNFEKIGSHINMEPIVVDKDCYFVLGDNRNHSNDSKDWENPYVHKSDIVGKVMF